MPVMIGADSHKSTHTLVALDEVGRKVAEKTLATTSEGHLLLLVWARQWSEQGVVFALEDCRHLTRRLEADLLAAGQKVVRVPTRLMADARRGARRPGKSDPIDAEAVALAAMRHPDLPVAELDGPAREVKLLSDYRHTLVVERTKIQSRLRWLLHELDPATDGALAAPSRSLRRRVVLERLAAELAERPGVVARLARELIGRCAQLTDRINALETELRALVRAQAPALLALPGLGVLGAAMIVGETAGVHRFRSKDAYARFTGTAPVPVWSGRSNGKVRLNRGGNRTINTALHMMALTQVRGVGPGKAYVEKVTTAGKTHKEAVRLLRRHLSDAVYSALRRDDPACQRVTDASPSTAPVRPLTAAA